MINPSNPREKIDAAIELLMGETTTVAKFEKIRTLVKGINPKIDTTLESCSKVIKKLKKISKAEVIELTTEALPEDTKEQKERKKVLLLLIGLWKDLRSEIKRIKDIHQSSHTSDKPSFNTQVTAFGKVIALAKGPFGLITGAAIVIVGAGIILNNLNVTTDIIIKNQGCAPISPVAKLPISIPGIKLPKEIIPNGSSGQATVPSISVVIDGSQKRLIKLTLLGISMNFDLQNENISLLFDNQSLIGKRTEIDLGKSKTHELVVKCTKIS